MMRIRFESIRIESLSDSSSVNAGHNVIVGRTSREQLNESFGSVGGNGNVVENGVHILYGSRPSGRREEA
jgi:hypothetical protein